MSDSRWKRKDSCRGKLRYHTYHEAEMEIERAETYRGEYMRAYECPKCGTLHLTEMAEEDFARINPRIEPSPVELTSYGSVLGSIGPAVETLTVEISGFSDKIEETVKEIDNLVVAHTAIIRAILGRNRFSGNSHDRRKIRRRYRRMLGETK